MENLNFELHIGTGWVSHERTNKNLLQFKYPLFNVFLPLNLMNSSQIKFGKFFYLKLLSHDYLDKNNKTQFADKIQSFLNEKLNYNASHIILQTLPRMFSYAFNPVSFWYLFQGEKLDAILCEVNNTFGDRHYYFVKVKSPNDTIQLNKEFHVSPFLNIEGHYKFQFAFTDKLSSVKIDYYNHKDELQLKTMIHLKRQSLEKFQPFKLLANYGWMTPLVIIRIHSLALKLWFKKVRFFKRPHPPQQEITK